MNCLGVETQFCSYSIANISCKRPVVKKAKIVLLVSQSVSRDSCTSLAKGKLFSALSEFTGGIQPFCLSVSPLDKALVGVFT